MNIILLYACGLAEKELFAELCKYNTPRVLNLEKHFFIFVATIGQIVTYRSVWLCPCWKSGTFQNVGIDNTTLITM